MFFIATVFSYRLPNHNGKDLGSEMKVLRNLLQANHDGMLDNMNTEDEETEIKRVDQVRKISL